MQYGNAAPVPGVPWQVPVFFAVFVLLICSEKNGEEFFGRLEGWDELLSK